MTESRAVVVEVIVAAPIDAVWKALRDPAVIAQWFGWNYPNLPAEIDHIFAKDATADAAAYRLALDPDEFTLEARGNETIVRLTRPAPAGGSWDDIYDEITEGWRTFVYQLRFAFAFHPGEARRTLYMSGRTRSGGTAPPEALGLSALGALTEGDPYSLTAATGDRLSGRIWFRSGWQIGLAVDGFGPGLLVAMRRPPTGKSPLGSGMLLLSLYGFDEGAHQALTERWQAWFGAHFDNVTVQT
jgi:hypothetical protein